MRIFNNDEAIEFFRTNGYPTTYNDGMLAWLRDYYSVTGGTLQDLLSRYIKDIGFIFDVGGGGAATFFILMEDGSFLLQEDGFKLKLEAA